jgi:hypothetical protein
VKIGIKYGIMYVSMEIMYVSMDKYGSMELSMFRVDRRTSVFEYLSTLEWMFQCGQRNKPNMSCPENPRKCSQ